MDFNVFLMCDFSLKQEKTKSLKYVFRVFFEAGKEKQKKKGMNDYE